VLADDKTELFSYNTTFSELTSATDPNGNTTTFGLDATNGNVLSITHPPVTHTSGDNGIVPNTFTHDSPVCSFTYTGGTRNAFLDSECDGNGNTLTMGYDTLDRLISMTYPTYYAGLSNPVVTFAYNGASDLISRQDENTFTTTYSRDSLGRVKAVTAPSNPGGTTTYGYDAASNLTSLTDASAAHNVTTFNHDSMNRVSTVIDPAGAPNNYVTTHVYDPAGNLQDLYDRDGRHRKFAYDAADRETTEQWLSGSTVLRTFTYSYDAASELTNAQDPDSDYSYTYDSRGRLISVDNTGLAGRVPHMVMTYGYDATGNRTSLTDSLGGSAAYTYNADDWLVSLSLQVAGKGPLVTLNYDTGGRLTYVQRSTPGVTGSVEVDTLLSYNARDLVKTIGHSVNGGASMLSTFSYGYDPATNLTNSTGPASESLTYAYDHVNELTGVTGTRTESYQYDANGNRTSANGSTYGTPGPDNELTFDGTYTYNYDAEGNLTSKVGASLTVTYTWDYRNRLTEAQTSAGADDQFTYDVNNLRIGKHSGNSSQTWIAYDGANPYADFNGASLSNRYLYGNAVDQLFARVDTGGNTTAWYLGDKLGSIRQLVSNNGTVLDNITYGDSYGNNPSDSQPANGDRFKFTGREYDSEIGVYYVRARYYNPAVGRFLSQDPIGFSARDNNLYRYVFNGPANGTDPTGLDNFWVLEPWQTLLDIFSSNDRPAETTAEKQIWLVP
jgi:RHS repeat-associated protein